MAGRDAVARRAWVLLAGVGLWILVLVGRLTDLQIARHAEFQRRARKQQERTVELPPRRGAILDAEGRPLAVTVAVESVFAIPSDVVEPEAVARELGPMVGLSARDLLHRLTDDPEREFVWIARRVPVDVARRVRARKLPGIRLLTESMRRYPQGASTGAVLGYVGLDGQGLGGLEHRYDSEIAGRPARVTLHRDAAQRSYAAASARPSVAEGTEGASLVLTLDAALQHVVERELESAAALHRARGASAVVLDPGTGAVLALASWPAFDPNRFGDADAEARRCRPVADLYEPGSAFKVVAAAAALEAGTISPDDLIDCGDGALSVGTWTIREDSGHRYAALSLGEVLARSSNVGIARVAMGLGRGPFYGAVRSFGFGRKSGLDLDGETSGLLREPAGWSALTLPTMAFGQEIGVNAVQMARAYAAIASGGVLPTPHLVREIRDPDGRVRRPAAPTRRVVSEATARTMRRLLVRVVEDGTGKLAAVPGYRVAGKTGTSQKAVVGGGYARDRHVASFIGMLPADRPRVVVTVVIDEPRGKYHGGDVAAPAFAAIAGEAMRLLGEPALETPDRARPPVLLADLATGSRLAGARPDALVPAAYRSGRRPPPPVEDGLVPDVTGLSARRAVRSLARAGLVATLSGSGFVVSQGVPAGALAERGAVCPLVLARDASPDAGASAPGGAP